MSEDRDPRDTLLHPRRRAILVGHEEAQARFVRMWNSQRLHHAWLISGAAGIGKATLAYRIARFVLAHRDDAAVKTATGLEVGEDDPTTDLIAAGSHPDLFVLEPAFDTKTKKVRTHIRAEDARAAARFFTLSAAFGGWRVCIVDSADDLNATAANALLKALEEPPPRCLFLIITQTPGRLLDTIRSRTLSLRLKPLPEADTLAVVRHVAPDLDDAETLARLAAGSPGRALALAGSRAADAYRRFAKAASQPDRAGHTDVLAVAEDLAGLGREGDYRLFCRLLGEWFAGQARAGALGGDARAAAHWAEAGSAFTQAVRDSEVYNLDRRSVVVNAFDMSENLPVFATNQ